MNFLSSLQNLSGPGASLEALPPVALDGLTNLAKDRCCSSAAVSPSPDSPLATSNVLFQQSLVSLSALLLQLLRPSRLALSGGGGGAAGKADKVMPSGNAAPDSSAKGSKSSKISGSPVGAGGGSVTGRPNGYNEIVSQFGQPGDRSNIVSVPMKAGPGGRTVPVQVHKKIADRLKNAFEEISAAGLSDEIKTFDGSYNARKKRGGSTWSVHSWGLAVDLNAGQYPMGTSAASTSPRYKQIAQIFARNGFYQLGNDPMHFQFATGY